MRQPRILAVASAVDLDFRYGCTPAWWQLWKGMYEAGVDLVDRLPDPVPLSGRVGHERALELHPDREEALDDRVVQAPRELLLRGADAPARLAENDEEQPHERRRREHQAQAVVPAQDTAA